MRRQRQRALLALQHGQRLLLLLLLLLQRRRVRERLLLLLLLLRDLEHRDVLADEVGDLERLEKRGEKMLQMIRFITRPLSYPECQSLP